VWACPSLSENHHLYAGNEGATPSTSFTQTVAGHDHREFTKMAPVKMMVPKKGIEKKQTEAASTNSCSVGA
jgi:hypothetical protein